MLRAARSGRNCGAAGREPCRWQFAQASTGGDCLASSGRAADQHFCPASMCLLRLASRRSDQRPIFVSDIFAHTELLAAPVFDAANERTRPNLKVQDGCDNRCSFCVIPYVRGQSRSLKLAEIIREVNALVDSGYREVVISGINLGRWGRDFGGGHQASGVSLHALPAQSPTPNASSTFESLIRAILAQTSLEKLRISSVEPMDWSDELIALVASLAAYCQARACAHAIRAVTRCCGACIASIVRGTIARRSRRFAPPCLTPPSAPT